MNKFINSVSVVIPMRNASTTVEKSLKSILKQNYPIAEVLVVDNASTDSSVEIVKAFKSNKTSISIYTQKENKGLGFSFNFAVQKVKSELVVFLHSDCSLQTPHELEKLIKPFEDKNVVATYPTIDLSFEVWQTYDYWEKCFFAREVGKGTAGLTTKFDCIRTDVYKKLKGFDTSNFGVGGEDADLHERLLKVGNVVLSSAVVTHLHYLGEGYSLKKFLTKERLYARTYGRIIRTQWYSFIPNGLIFFVKPTLSVLPFFSYSRNVGIVLLVIFSFLYTKRMFTTRETLFDVRIILVPFLNIFVVYYETFWMIESFFFGKNKIE